MDYTHGILTGLGGIGIGLVIIGLAIWRKARERRADRSSDEERKWKP